MLQRVLRKLVAASRPSGTPVRRVRPTLEALEDRAVPTAYTWTGALASYPMFGPYWSVSGNWSPNGVPGASDDVTVSGGPSSVANRSVNSVTVSGGTVQVNTSQTFGSVTVSSGQLQANTSLTVTTSLTQSGGTVTVATGLLNSLTVDDVSQTGGTIQVNTGQLTVTDSFSVGGDLQILSSGIINANGTNGMQIGSNGRLYGEGVVYGDVTNAGIVDILPYAYGQIDIHGNYTQTSTGTLKVYLLETGAGDPCTCNRLYVYGNITLDGTLDAILKPGVGTPQAGDVYHILGFTGTRTGTFATVIAPAGLAISYNSADITLVK
jgi:hypothetical protein